MLAADSKPGVHASTLRADGSYAGILSVPGNVCGGNITGSAFLQMDGQAVFKFAVRKTEEISRRVLDRNGLTPADLSLFVSHQANRRIIEAASERLGLGPDKVIINLEMYGNTTAGTIPLALADARKQGRLKKGDLVLLASVGAGFTVGSVLVRW